MVKVRGERQSLFVGCVYTPTESTRVLYTFVHI